jgi:nucleoside-diphosphate-sugar epimerase
MSLSNKRVFITGATGFIGSALALRLSQNGARVAGLARNPAKAAFLERAGVDVIQGDVTDLARMRRVIAGAEVVFHLAAAAGFRKASVIDEVNVRGTGNVLGAARAAGVARFVHVSTMSVYGYDRQGAVDEEVALRPTGDPYGDTKAVGERLALKSGLPVTVVRPAQVYGPRSAPWTLRMLALTRWFVPLVGDGSGACHPIYIDDLIDLLVLAGSHPEAPGQIFNGSPDPPSSWRDFLGAYGRMHGHQRFLRIPRWLLAAPLAALDPALRLTGRRVPLRNMLRFMTGQVTFVNRKARELLGWEPRVSLEKGMRRTEAWLRAEGYLPARPLGQRPVSRR